MDASLQSWGKVLPVGEQIFYKIPRLPDIVSSWNVTSVMTQAGFDRETAGFLYRRTMELPYCEGKYGGLFYGGVSNTPQNHLPERSSTYSAPFILLCGLHMLFFWRHDSGLIHLISALFALNGVAAFLAHYYALTMWHNVDSKTMLLAVWLAYSMVFSELVENLFRMANATHRSWRVCRDLVTASNWLFCVCSFYWITESNATFGANEYGRYVGALGTAVPLALCVVAGFLHVLCGCGKSDSMTGKMYRRARFRFFYGVGVASFGCAMWIFTERSCDQTDAMGYFFRWFPGHFVWHVTCAYGMSNAMLFAAALRADNFRTMVSQSGAAIPAHALPASRSHVLTHAHTHVVIPCVPPWCRCTSTSRIAAPTSVPPRAPATAGPAGTSSICTLP